MANSNDRLIAEIRRRQAAANRKVSRLRGKGVQIGGSQHDPRMPLASVLKSTPTEQRRYLKSLTSFTSRNTSFVLGSGGQTIPGSKWKEYKALEARYNERVRKHEVGFSNVTPPGSGQTLGDRRKSMLPNRGYGANSNRAFSTENKLPERINGEQALDKLIKDMKRKLNPGYFKDFVSASRSQTNELFNELGMPELTDRLYKLSDYQYNVLVHESSAANNISSLYYLVSKSNLSFGDKAFDDQYGDVVELIEFAERLPKNEAAANAARTRQARRK